MRFYQEAIKNYPEKTKIEFEKRFGRILSEMEGDWGNRISRCDSWNCCDHCNMNWSPENKEERRVYYVRALSKALGLGESGKGLAGLLSDDVPPDQINGTFVPYNLKYYRLVEVLLSFVVE